MHRQITQEYADRGVTNFPILVEKEMANELRFYSGYLSATFYEEWQVMPGVVIYDREGKIVYNAVSIPHEVDPTIKFLKSLQESKN